MQKFNLDINVKCVLIFSKYWLSASYMSCTVLMLHIHQ